jgi:hypothetical protein
MPTEEITRIGKRSTEQAVLEALAAGGEASTAEIASAAGVGRSSAAKCLAALERAGKVTRSPGGREGGRRLPDRWSAAAEGKAPPAKPRAGGGGERLRPGQLDGLVLAYLREHAAEGPLSPTAVGKALERSSGAVGNCLARLAEAGRAREVSERPRRYAIE